MDGPGTVASFKFMGEDVGAKCVASILGIGSSRLRKGAAMVPDLRCGKDKSMSQRDTWSIDAFLTVLYEGIAETLPDRRAVQPTRMCFFEKV